MSLTGACESWEAGKALGDDWTLLVYSCCAADCESAQTATTSELSCVSRQMSQCCTAAAGLSACKSTEHCSMWLVDHGSSAVHSTKGCTLQVQSRSALYALDHAAHEEIAVWTVRSLSGSHRNAYERAHFPRNKLKSSYTQLFRRLTHPSLLLGGAFPFYQSIASGQGDISGTGFKSDFRLTLDWTLRHA